MKTITKLMMTVLVCIGFSACYVEDVQAEPLQRGCVLVEDANYGETMVCNTYYTTVGSSVIVYDPIYGVWLGGGSYWYGGRWVAGRPYGWGARWGGTYGWRAHGYYYNRGYRGYYGGHSYGGHYGGGFHGGGRR
jgi:hypothetical protein